MLRILPAKQGSQIGSGFAEDWSVRPVPRSPATSFLMSGMLWWQRRRCSKLRSSGIVETTFAASGGTVVPFKTAEQLEVVVAVNRRGLQDYENVRIGVLTVEIRQLKVS